MSRRRRMEHLYARNLSGHGAGAQFARGKGSILERKTQSRLDFPAETIPSRAVGAQESRDRLILRIAEGRSRASLVWGSPQTRPCLRSKGREEGGREGTNRVHVRVISPRESRHVEQSGIKSRVVRDCSSRRV